MGVAEPLKSRHSGLHICPGKISGAELKSPIEEPEAFFEGEGQKSLSTKEAASGHFGMVAPCAARNSLGLLTNFFFLQIP